MFGGLLGHPLVRRVLALDPKQDDGLPEAGTDEHGGKPGDPERGT